jgi:hypothetical protein
MLLSPRSRALPESAFRLDDAEVIFAALLAQHRDGATRQLRGSTERATAHETGANADGLHRLRLTTHEKQLQPRLQSAK